ncbi:MAG: hypothetical protein EOP04_29670, partial [Proteobacteria bacterium]
MAKATPQRSHSLLLSVHDLNSIFTKLFQDAKASDEFEFCSAILRLRGLEGPGWDPLKESSVLIQQMLGLMASPIESSFRTRIALFLYCHVTEMHDLYHVVGNMLLIAAGSRYNFNCFSGLTALCSKPANYPPSKASNIELWSIANEFPELGNLFGDLVVNEVRNAFFHSDYVLTPESFNIRRGQGVKIGNVIDPKVRFEWLMPRLELGINVGLTLIQFVQSALSSYEENKVVKGRFHSNESVLVDIELTTTPGYGLT